MSELSYGEGDEQEQLTYTGKKRMSVDKSNIGGMLTEWFELKGTREELKRHDDMLRLRQEDLEVAVIELMEAEDLVRADCEKGSVTLKVKSMPRIVDFEAFAHWVAEDLTARLGFLYRQVKETAVNEMLEETGSLPNGVDTYLKTRLNKRSKKG